MSRPKIAKLIQGVSMQLGHDGLARILRQHDIEVSELAQGDLVMILNGFGDKMKILGCKGLVLGYLKMPNKQKIMREALQYIPKTFGAGSFDYAAACRQALVERMGIRRQTGPLANARAAQRAGL